MQPHRRSLSRRAFARLAGSAGLGALGLSANVASGRAAAATTLTLYSAQHQQSVDMVINAFTKASGIEVRSHHGEAPEIAAQIIREGAHSPADVYFTENSPELVLLAEKGLLSKVSPKTLAQVPAKYSAPGGEWIGVLARENVLAFNPKMVKEADLPASLLDLGQPAWKGKVAIAPSDADFLPLVKAVAEIRGRPAALAWLKGLKANAQVFDDDEGVVAAVERGASATGVINNYYWARLRTEQGADRTVSQIHHFSNGDVGALINVSGAAVLKSSRNQEAAQKLVAFLVSKQMQEVLAKSDVDFEYPLADGVAPNPLLKPFDQLQPLPLTVDQLGDDRESAQLLRQAGLL